MPDLSVNSASANLIVATPGLLDKTFPTSPRCDDREHFLREKGMQLINRLLPLFKEHSPVMLLPRPLDTGIGSLAIFYSPKSRAPLVFESRIDFAQLRRQELLNRLAQDFGRLATSGGKNSKIFRHSDVRDWKHQPIEAIKYRSKMETLIQKTLSSMNGEMFSKKLNLTPQYAHLAVELEREYVKAYTSAVHRGLAEISGGLSNSIDEALELPTVEGLRQYGVHFYLRALKESTSTEVRNRTLWMKTFPYFADAPNSGQFDDIVRSREPFIPVAANHYNCTPALIKRLGKLEFYKHCLSSLQAQRINEDKYRSHLVNYLNSAPIEKVTYAELTQNPKGIFKQLDATLYFLMDFPSKAEEMGVHLLSASSAGNWENLNKTVSLETLNSVHDYVRMVSRATVLPWLISQGRAEWDSKGSVVTTAQQITTLILAKKCHLGTLTKLSHEWHRVVGRSNTSDYFNHTSWEALFSPQQTPNNFLLVPLTDSNELNAEGAALHHCVGGYANLCIYDNMHIISVRTIDGERVSTLQLQNTIRDTKREVKIIQHKQAWNQPVSEELAIAAEWLTEQVNNGEIVVDWESIDRNANAKKSVDLAGFDVNDKILWHKIYQTTLSFVPGQFRYKNVEEFISSSGYHEYRELFR
jgi:hypothetical protein